jgi:hypothetical protein
VSRSTLARTAGLATLSLLVLQLSTLAVGQALTPIDVNRLGPQVDQQVPDFALVDQSGKTWTRQSIMGAKGAMIVFFRSADW